MFDFKAQAEQFGVFLGALASITYLSGYLSLRMRANALGLDPGFTLVNEGYVFAGARFLFSIFPLLLLTSPLVLGLRWAGAWFAGKLPGIAFGAHWTAASVLLLAGILSTVLILPANNMLLDGQGGPFMREAILGSRPAWGRILMMSMVLLSALALLLFIAVRRNYSGHTLVWFAGTAAALLLVLLPVYHGVLQADRKVRVLGSVPEKSPSLAGPVGIVDRTSEYATLFGRDTEGRRVLVSVKIEDLAGVSITGVQLLPQFLKALEKPMTRNTPEAPGSRLAGAAKDSADTAASGAKGGTGKPASRPSGIKGFFSTLTEQLMVSFDAIGSLGRGAKAGEIWAVDLDPAGKPSPPRCLSTLKDLAWPVASPDGKSIYALRAGKAVRLDDPQWEPKGLGAESRWVKLLGITPEQNLLGLIGRDGKVLPCLRTQDGSLQVFEEDLDEEDSRRLAVVADDARAYQGGREVTVRRSENGRGSDVYFKIGKTEYKVSDSRGAECGQPFLSADSRLLLYIRQPRD